MSRHQGSSVWSRFGDVFGRHRLLQLMSMYPPYLGAGIRVTSVTDDFQTIDVAMQLHTWNMNYVGTHFGGSLYTMCDPFYMIILLEKLGRDYIVWDKAATIQFKKPGRGRVTARFHVSAEQLEVVRATTAADGKCEPTFVVEVKDAEGDVIARVEKVLYVRRRPTDD